ncbi:MAG TPA: N-6 DNA methylase [Armatimonadota bacterium]|nr:N-6 DNA methylase [Armatimonadota bacterium]
MTRRGRRCCPRTAGASTWDQAIAVGDAKAWGIKLDKAVSGAKGWSFQNPSFQIYYYLAETGCRWAILTNGRLWRLYSSEPKPDMQVYYEVDLPALLQSGNPDDLAYFWLFFRCSAFVAGVEGVSFLEQVQAESDLAADKLREDVREGVYRALLEACRGFLGYAPNGLGESDLDEVYDNALVFLYRLLFVLYAEAAELLPLRENVPYRDQYSLHAIKNRVAANPDGFIDGIAAEWPKLKALSGIIDKGHEALGVPAYNGGLFDPGRHPFLERSELSDAAVAKVVDLLARTPEGRFADYRDLGVRHIGSIYEGLLEYRLAVASEPMVVVRKGGKDLWVPDESVAQAFLPADADAAAGKNARPTKTKATDEAERCEAGEVYLVTDRGERKATGSYYTPQFIVEYIVENTIGPVIDACETSEEVLDLNVLDPAMGSGHFLVEATNFIARKLMERGASLGVYGDGLYAAAKYGKAKVDEEADVVRLKRMVVERCIHGVDVNPLAVELAKLSLWLNTVSKGEPLSFLDHHLRCGNSLIGARVEDLPTPPEPKKRKKKAKTAKAEAAGQLALFDYDDFALAANRLVFGFGEISHALSDSREAVQQKARILAQIDEAHRRPYREIGDVWCSRFFGNEIDATVYGELVQHLQTSPPSQANVRAASAATPSPEDLAALSANGVAAEAALTGAGAEPSGEAATALDVARSLAERYRFFHWELEFPEVFFDQHGRKLDDPGFDAVVGNPPWERIKLQDNEFFARRAPVISLAPTAAKRKAMIAALPETDPELAEQHARAKEQAEFQLAWTRSSGQYPLMGKAIRICMP